MPPSLLGVEHSGNWQGDGTDEPRRITKLERIGSVPVAAVTGGVVAPNNERLAFVFDRQRVHPSGLACELVVAAEGAGIPERALEAQFARTPDAVSFARDASVFTLITLHVTYGQGPQDRVVELERIARWLASWAKGRDPERGPARRSWRAWRSVAAGCVVY